MDQDHPAARLPRRSLAGLAAGLALVVPGRGPVQSQEATPAAATAPSWLFVQRFGSATLAPAAGDPAGWVLTLSGLDAAVLAFADHPDRLAATVPTAAFVEAVAGEAGDPLNATLVAVQAGAGGEAAAVVELLGAAFDPGAGMLAYRVGVLAEAEGPFAPGPLPVGAVPLDLGVGHLFVDSATLGEMATNVQGSLGDLSKGITAGSYAAGAAHEVGGVVRLKRQKRRQQRQGG